MYAMDSGDEYEDEPMTTNMLKDIRGSSKYHLGINSRGARYKIRDNIKRRQSEWKGALLSTRNMGKGLNKVFKTVTKENLQYLPIQGKSGSEVSYLIPDPRNVSKVTRLSDNVKKPWLKATKKEIKNIINNQTFLVQEPKG